MQKLLSQSQKLDAKEKYIQKCVKCRKEHIGFSKKCDKCGGMIELFYNLKNFERKKSSNSYERFFDILPIKNKKNLMWLGEGNTPLIHSKKIGKKIGLKNLYLKCEGTGPTQTTKDRMATVSLSYLYENSIKEFVTASTGNTGTSYAHGILKHPYFKMHLVYHGSPSRLNFEMNENIKIYRVKGDFVNSCAQAMNFAHKNKLVFEGGFFNPGRREGLKMAFIESIEQMSQEPDWYFQAVSSSMGVVGTYKAAQELISVDLLEKKPKLGCIQQKSCNPMVRAWKNKSEKILPKHIIENPQGIAKAILRGNPTNTYPIVRDLVIQSKGLFEDVTRNEIIKAVHLLKSRENLDCSPESGVALSGLIKATENGLVDKDEVILVNLTGGIRKRNIYPKEFNYI
ncbi:MAG: pyridoxal-5'-phosphate-dependent protein subunit beta [Candidatus Diapherotrites archaeon CG11_big_fil_rev_8_21_14_0_20_37_9]|nr:MAG: pyridoxal-5'-phosphate-dependent protein subunit beta [Candidatus Diapherotrites archaeon CG11_big_fil_rev_8_21_14_0_20_37_9]